MNNSYTNNHPFLIEDQDTGYLYYLKCISSIRGSRNATVTQYPTVSGKSISDNMYIEPKTLSVSTILGSILASQNKYVGEDGTLVSISSEQLKQKFKDWQQDSIRLNITTFEDSFQNMVINSLQSSEGDELGTWKLDITFMEVRIAEVTEIKLDFGATSEEEANNNTEQSLGSDNGSGASEVGSFIGNVGIAAAAGAGIGSLIGGPGVGTAVGAVVGGIVGFFNWLFN